MAELFATGQIVDLILVLVGAEAVLLIALGSRVGARRRLGDVLAFLASGACLLLALRVALIGGWWGWIALALTAAFVGHLGGLRLALARTPAR